MLYVLYKSVSCIEFLMEFCMYDEVLLQQLLIKSNVLYSGKAWQGPSLAGEKFGKLSRFEHLVKKSLAN